MLTVPAGRCFVFLAPGRLFPLLCACNGFSLAPLRWSGGPGRLGVVGEPARNFIEECLGGRAGVIRPTTRQGEAAGGRGPVVGGFWRLVRTKLAGCAASGPVGEVTCRRCRFPSCP